MKKILSGILILVSLIVSAQSAMAYNSYVYTASGIMEPESRLADDYRLSAIGCPGAIVKSDYSIFDKIIINHFGGTDGDSYSCYGSSICGDTLTLGMTGYANGFSYAETKESLQRCVRNQINYINSIGGVMTGYTIEPYDNICALNISWDVGDVHHYARFYKDRYGLAMGYYDIMYSDNSASQYLISGMNNNFWVNYEGQ